MHFRRLAAFLLGAWLAGSVWMDLIAIENFRSVDLLLAEPSLGAAARIRAMGREEARTFLRHHVAEQNRQYFETWERIQFGLALALFLVLMFGAAPSRFSLILCVGMFLLVVVDRFVLTPEITKLGRLIDFLPATTPSPERGRFWTFHGAYSSLEIAKLGLGLVLAGTLLLRGRHDRKRFSREVDSVNKADDRHVDG